MRRTLFRLLIVPAVLVVIGLSSLSLALAQPSTARTVDPPLCRLVPMEVQVSGGGTANAWFRWCGLTTPDGPAPLRLAVHGLKGDAFAFDASQCPKANPCTIYWAS